MSITSRSKAVGQGLSLPAFPSEAGQGQALPLQTINPHCVDMRQAGARRSQETVRSWERLAPAWRVLVEFNQRNVRSRQETPLLTESHWLTNCEPGNV